MLTMIASSFACFNETNEIFSYNDFKERCFTLLLIFFSSSSIQDCFLQYCINALEQNVLICLSV